MRGTRPWAHAYELSAKYKLHEAVPSVADYLVLRRISGLTPRSAVAAEAGLLNSLFALWIEHDGKAVAMGRIIGDGALFLHIVDVAVDPEHQGKSLGKVIVACLLSFVERTVPAEAYVSLMASGTAHRLYEEFGFLPVMPDARGMALWANG